MVNDEKLESTQRLINLEQKEKWVMGRLLIEIADLKLHSKNGNSQNSLNSIAYIKEMLCEIEQIQIERISCINEEFFDTKILPVPETLYFGEKMKENISKDGSKDNKISIGVVYAVHDKVFTDYESALEYQMDAWPCAHINQIHVSINLEDNSIILDCDYDESTKQYSYKIISRLSTLSLNGELPESLSASNFGNIYYKSLEVDNELEYSVFFNEEDEESWKGELFLDVVNAVGIEQTLRNIRQEQKIKVRHLSNTGQ